jgi:flagellar biosynthesis chaperone FliJ
MLALPFAAMVIGLIFGVPISFSLAKLDHAVAFQNGVLERLQLHVDHCKQLVVQAERELASLQKYAERREHHWQRQQDRQEQRNNDEMAANVHQRNAAPTPWKDSA